MRRVLVLAVLLAAAAAVAGCGSTGSTSLAGLVSIGAGLKGPAGLTATVYARGLPHAAAFAQDRAGRLWVATAAYSQHAGDGVYVVPHAGAKPVKVIAGLVTPLGLVWSGTTLYVSSLGRVDAYSGLRADRFAHHRTVLLGPVRRGENNGLVQTRDGRLLMGVTASCDHCVPASRRSGAIVSFRPDGSDLRVYASRIRAPVGLAFVPGTTDLLVSMNQRDDLGARTPGDWLAQVRDGQDWGFPSCYGQGGSACRGVSRPIAALDAHAAAGAVVVASGQLGGAVGTAALVSEWQLGKVQRVTLTRSGSTYTGTASTLITGIRNPLALLLARDGSLLAGDWGSGTVYRLAPPLRSS